MEMTIVGIVYLLIGIAVSVFVSVNSWGNSGYCATVDDFIVRWLRAIFWPFTLFGFILSYSPRSRLGAVSLLIFDPVRAFTIFIYGPQCW